MKKRIISLALALAMVFATAASVYANPGQNPNQNPGSPQQEFGGVVVTVTGGGNNLVIRAFNPDGSGEYIVIPRAGNGTFTQSFTAFHRSITINVRGNSLVGVSGAPTPDFENAARQYCRYTTYVFVWNRLWTGTCPIHGAAFRQAGFLSQFGGLAHYNALRAHYGLGTLPHFYGFNVDMADVYEFWADELEVGLLRVFSPDQLDEFIQEGLGVNMRFWVR